MENGRFAPVHYRDNSSTLHRHVILATENLPKRFKIGGLKEEIERAFPQNKAREVIGRHCYDYRFADPRLSCDEFAGLEYHVKPTDKEEEKRRLESISDFLRDAARRTGAVYNTVSRREGDRQQKDESERYGKICRHQLLEVADRIVETGLSGWKVSLKNAQSRYMDKWKKIVPPERLNSFTCPLDNLRKVFYGWDDDGTIILTMERNGCKETILQHDYAAYYAKDMIKAYDLTDLVPPLYKSYSKYDYE